MFWGSKYQTSGGGSGCLGIVEPDQSYLNKFEAHPKSMEKRQTLTDRDVETSQLETPRQKVCGHLVFQVIQDRTLSPNVGGHLINL